MELRSADELQPGAVLRTAGVRKDGLPDRGKVTGKEDASDGERLVITVEHRGRTYTQEADPGDLYYVEA
jgi:hypothetical protein